MEDGSAKVNNWQLADLVVAWDPWRCVAAFMMADVLSSDPWLSECLNYRFEGRNAM